MEQASSPPSGPPYAPPIAVPGGIPTIGVDVPISACLMLLYACAAAGHMTLLQVNNRRKHKFIISGMLFGFCMARLSTLSVRIAWAVHPSNVSLQIAAQVLVAAGVVLLFLVDLVFAQRIVRALHPRFGWHSAFGRAFVALYAILVISLIMLIAVGIISFYTLDENTRRIARDIQWYGQSAFLLMCLLPIPLVLGAAIFPRPSPVEKFGSGRFRTKIAVLLAGTTILALGAAFRLGTNVLPPRPLNDPAWYQSRPAFYCFNFVVEIIVIYLYLVLRVDLRFHVPNGAKGPGDYRHGPAAAAAAAAAAAESTEKTASRLSSTSDHDVTDAPQESARAADGETV